VCRDVANCRAKRPVTEFWRYLLPLSHLTIPRRNTHMRRKTCLNRVSRHFLRHLLAWGQPFLGTFRVSGWKSGSWAFGLICGSRVIMEGGSWVARDGKTGLCYRVHAGCHRCHLHRYGCHSDHMVMGCRVQFQAIFAGMMGDMDCRAAREPASG
jgi:hypothetical protein